MGAAEGKNKRKVGTASTEGTAGKPEKPFGRNIINGRSSITTSGIVLTSSNRKTAETAGTEINGKHGSNGKISGTIDCSPVLPKTETGEPVETAGKAGITKTTISSSNGRI